MTGPAAGRTGRPNVNVVGPDPIVTQAIAALAPVLGPVTVVVLPDATFWRSFERDAGGPPLLVVVDGPPDGDALHAMVRRGAAGVVSVDSDESAFVGALERVAAGSSHFDEVEVRRLLDAIALDATLTSAVDLTRREREVLRAIDDGRSVAQTAIALGVSPKTVENTQRYLFRKLGVTNRVQAVGRAHALGLLDGPTTDRLTE